MVPYKTLFQKLHKHKVQYLVAGGFAVNFHQVQRATLDLDLIVYLEKSNLKKFISIMKELKFSPRLPVKPEDFIDKKTRDSWIKKKNTVVFSFNNDNNPLEVVDIFIKEPKPFKELFNNKFQVMAFGIQINVLGIHDLIEMKQEAGRDKDLFDIKMLKKKSEQDE